MERKEGTIRIVVEDIEMDELGINIPNDNSTSSQPHENYMVYPNSLSNRQMKALTALCDTFVPSIDASRLTTDESVLKFYATSASMVQTPERVS